MEKLKVLIADDNPRILKMLGDILMDDNGIEVVGTAEDGVETMGMIEETKPDVLLLDLIMPKLDGEHDYVGVKIAQAMLFNDETELAAMKEQYASVIEEAKVKRNEVNTYTKWLNDNDAAIQAAQEVIQNEH